VASCPSGSIYKREEDGIVLIDQDKCRGWRMCVSGCPYKKIYYNWQTGKAEKCIFCYPRIEAGQPTVCSETCVGRIRYLGVMLYDADRIEQAASVADERDLYQSQLDVFLDPHDPKIQAEALRQGIPQSWLDAAASRRSTRWPGVEGGLPAASGIPHAADGLVHPAALADPVGRGIRLHGHERRDPDVKSLRIPVKYLANLLTAGDVPVLSALERMLAMRAYKRSESGRPAGPGRARTGRLTPAQVEDMYQIMAIANYEDRFVVPSSHKEMAEDSDEKAAAVSASATAARVARRTARCSARRSPSQKCRTPTCRARAARPSPVKGRSSNHAHSSGTQHPALLPRTGMARQPRGSQPRAGRMAAGADMLAPLLDELRSRPLIELQENYVATFDRSPSHSLHLFEHVHGESRDRGQAMVDLIDEYRRRLRAAGDRTARLRAAVPGVPRRVVARWQGRARGAVAG
jgi:ferredoxin